MLYRFIKKRLKIILAIAILIGPSLFLLPEVFAQTYLTQSSVVLTNMGAGNSSSIIVVFTTSSLNTGTNGSLVFSGWTGSGGTGTIATPQTVSNSLGSANCETITGASANLPGSASASGNAATGTITITDPTALAVSTSYCYVLTNAITANPTSPGQTAVALTEGSDAATNVMVDIISNNQIIVSATVPPSFTMSLSANADTFTSALSASSVVGTNGVAVTFNTNANSGWYLYGSDSNTGLKSSTENHTIASKTPGSNATLSSGTEGYLTGLPSAGISQGTGSGTTAASTPFSSSGLGNGSGLNTTPALLASSNGTANAAAVTVKEYAAISPITPSAQDYTDTISLVGAGSF